MTVSAMRRFPRSLPCLSRLNSNRLKRRASEHDAEQPPTKRQHFREYDEIVNDVLKVIETLIRTCQDPGPVVYRRTFTGVNSQGERDETMTFTIEATSAVRPRTSWDDYPTSFNATTANEPRYELTFSLADKYGRMPIWGRMDAAGVPLRQVVYCGASPRVLREQLAGVVYPWLNWAHAHFGLHNLA